MSILVVDAVVAGALGGLVANAADSSGAVIAVVAGVTGVVYLVAWLVYIGRRITAQQRTYEALFPHPGA
jgi:uncharacterized membrane protein YeaQ/YmgE (transglycosylase-associated protein family)